VPEGAIAASAHDTLLGAWNQGGSGAADAPANRPDFHPATRVVLDTRVLSGRRSLGRLSTGAILAQTRKRGYWPFRLCLEEGIRAGTDVRGKAVFRFSIAGRGKVTYVRRMSSEFSAPVSDCMRKAGYSLVYDAAPARRVDVELVAQLSAGDAPLPARDAPGPAFDERAYAAALDDLTPVVAQCWTPKLALDDKLWGRVEMRLLLSEPGTVTDASELGSRFPDPQVTLCIRSALVGRELGASAVRDLVVAWRLGEWTAP